MSTPLRLISSLFGTVFIGFGINAIVNPESALAFFELQYHSSLVPNTQLADVLLAVYGIRDIFMGLAIYIVAYLGGRHTLGWVMLLASAVAFADGAVCKMMVGNGEWNHWGYAPVVGVLGGFMVLG